ncbi:MAG: phosphoribosylanthranilate isomerase [FCB group bacterium]|jgi:phosphoribosylanthranilate isomerase|nr:phosphoribosylanthranilate isomerase [FCB group bacterium]
MKVKICGITNLDDALAACDAGADALGFNFAPEARKRNRYIDPEAAQRIVELLPPFVTTVAVCVNDSPEHLLQYLTFVDWVQLHGEETVEQCEPVAKRAIKAFRAAPGFEPESVLAYPTASYLLDAYVPDARGGTGETCDWELARSVVALGRPVFLAGGLTPGNVAEAVRLVRPYGVDTAGGVEASPGLKDRDKMRNFIRHAKTAFLS